jgi:hypothetical protein
VANARRNDNDDDDDEQDEEAGEYDPVEEAAFEVQQRLWVRTLLPIVNAPAQYDHDEPRVRYAVEMAAIAAAERIGRICRGDLIPSDE